VEKVLTKELQQELDAARARVTRLGGNPDLVRVTGYGELTAYTILVPDAMLGKTTREWEHGYRAYFAGLPRNEPAYIGRNKTKQARDFLAGYDYTRRQTRIKNAQS